MSDKWICSRKHRYETQMECEYSIQQKAEEIPLRAYHCKVCDGWHKTKQKENPPAILAVTGLAAKILANDRARRQGGKYDHHKVRTV